jgi:hypothetical protein
LSVVVAVTPSTFSHRHYDALPMRLADLRLMQPHFELGSFLETSIRSRLALAVWATQFQMCSLDRKEHKVSDLPSCLNASSLVRHQWFGCDIEVDADVTGFHARLHECNVGPDMSPHSPKDRDLKREVLVAFFVFLLLLIVSCVLVDLGP